MDLSEFLLARIREDEAAARGAAHDFPDFLSTDDQDSARVAHFARWDPARVLAECEAKRWIVERHKPFPRIYGVGCDVCLQPRHLPADAPGWPCLTVRLLALPYSDHPAYRQEWDVQ